MAVHNVLTWAFAAQGTCATLPGDVRDDERTDTMGTFWGMDPETARAVAQRMREAAQRLVVTMRSLLALLGPTRWTGEDASAFRADLEHAVTVAAERAEALAALADELEHQADAQNAASQPEGASGDALETGAELPHGLTGGTAPAGVTPPAGGPLVGGPGSGGDGGRDPGVHRRRGFVEGPWPISGPFAMSETERRAVKEWMERAGGPIVRGAEEGLRTIAEHPELLQHAMTLPPVSDGPSHGVFRDALGDDLGRTTERAYWEGKGVTGALGRVVPGAGQLRRAQGPVGALVDIGEDAAMIGVEGYSYVEGARTGDLFRAADGAIGMSVAGLDAAAQGLSLVPGIPGVAGKVVSTGTEGLRDLWADAHEAALDVHEAGGPGDGSPTRTLVGLPQHLEQPIRQAADAVPFGAGAPVSHAAQQAADASRYAERYVDAVGAAEASILETHAPTVHELMGQPRRIIETPRKIVEAFDA